MRRLSSLIVPSALVLGLSACSLLVDFDPEGQPCDRGQCLEGYVCRDEVCVSDDGTPAGDAGTTDAGTSDAGTSDAGATDAGDGADAGLTDGGLSPDAGLGTRDGG
ncbi:hypothetical protein JYK02_01950 [Corallococcus macrosporus]|uniref:Lipoprotein n=1 Tax=Corallococcus macrosporus TaxID=35 RepID=A0ABS3D3P8_9BACT|nr:hypothetical protein [Corallococcus macrosporus]MBN8226268.1 hypothetical protein [Corallococcus macrosporus]